MTSPDVDFVTEHSILKHSMDTTQLNIDQILSEQRKNKIAERPVKVKEFLVRKEQMIKLNVFSDWVQELKTAIGIKLKANEMGSIQKEKTTMKEHWTMWKAEKSIQQGYANVYNAIKKIEIKMIFRSTFYAWLRAQKKFRKRYLKTVIENKMTRQIMKSWNLHVKVISRSKQLMKKQLLKIVKPMFHE